MRRTTVSATDEYRAREAGGDALMQTLFERMTAPFRPSLQRSQPEPQTEDIYDMTIYDEPAEDDPGAWVRELEERRANITDPFASLDRPASDDPEFDEMVAHRTRFERAALAAERVKRPDFGRSVGDVPTLTRAEHERLWESTKRDDVVGDLSWLER